MNRSLLDTLLEPGALQASFQPVVDMAQPSRPCHYLEGLIRGPRGTNVERPEILFDYARRKRGEGAVDRACLRTLLMAATSLPHRAIGVNVHAATLAADLELLNFLGDLLSETGLPPERLVVELVEHGQAWDQRALLLSLQGLRGIGVRVALDDFGTGQANYQMLLECRPDYLKIDRCFVHGCHADPRRQAFIDSLAALAYRIGARIVAEGVEDPADLARVRAAGIELVQGYLLGGPAPVAAWQGRCA